MTKEKILQSLKQIVDPELGANIVDLGLIYKIDVDNKKNAVKVVMTLTTPFCPFNNYILEQVEKILKDLNFNKVDLKLSFDPPWNPAMMSVGLKNLRFAQNLFSRFARNKKIMIKSKEKINKNLSCSARQNLFSCSTRNDLPQHLAIMIDGNRRWAKAKHLSSWFGHKAGIKRVIEIIKYAKKKGIKVLTLYGFSTENWNRSKEEVNYLMELFSTFAKKYVSQFKKKGIQFRHLGDIKDLPKQLQRNIQKACELTKDNQEMILNIALNYGGRDEITRAVQKIIQERIPAKKITEQLIMTNLDTKGLPDVDFIIRTSGEMRLSNFLPLQGAYAELYFPKVYWPDFNTHQFDLALEEFKKRRRKFGR